MTAEDTRGAARGEGGAPSWRVVPDASLELARKPAPPPPPRESAPETPRGLAPRPPRGDAASERRWARAARVLVALVLGLLLHGAWRVGPTYDEHYYIATGRAYLDEPFFGLNREHPPLLKVLAGLPLLALGADPPPDWIDEISYPASFFYGSEAEHLDRNLFAARVPFCLLAAAVVWCVFRVGRAWFGARAGFAGAALLGLNPNWLAHGRLAALDAGAAAFVFFALIAFVRALESPTARRTLGAGLLFGLANLAKFTGLLLGPACVALAAFAAWRERSARPLLVLARVLLAGLGVFAAGYAFEARSLDWAWGEPGYAAAVERPEPRARELADAFERALADVAPRPTAAEALLLDLSRAGRGEPAARRLIQGLDDPSVAPSALEALAALEGGPGDLRRDAVGALLAEPRALDASLVLATLERLSERTLVHDGAADDAAKLAAWRAWFDRARHEDWNERIFAVDAIHRAVRALFGDHAPVPLLTAIKGVDYQLAHGKKGHSTYFNPAWADVIVGRLTGSDEPPPPGRTFVAGKDFEHGNPHPEYYAVVMAVKNPLAALLAVAGGLALALATPRRFGVLRLLACAGFPALCFAMFSTGNALMGVRYLLPLFPFLALFAARLAQAWSKVALVLVAVAVGESAWIHPHELMYYNVLAGGPEHGPAITVVSDDWGQGTRTVGRFLARHTAEIEAAGGLWYTPYSVADPRALGLEAARALDPRRPVSGIVAVDAVNFWRERNKYGWLEPYEPFTRLDHCVLLFDTRGGPPGRDPGWR